MFKKKITKKDSKNALSDKYLTNNWYYRYPAYLMTITLVICVVLSYGFVMNIWAVYFGQKVEGTFTTTRCSLQSTSHSSTDYSCDGTFTPNDTNLSTVIYGSGTELDFPYFTKSGQTFDATIKLTPGEQPTKISAGDPIVIDHPYHKRLSAANPSIGLLFLFGFLGSLAGYYLQKIIKRQILRKKLKNSSQYK